MTWGLKKHSITRPPLNMACLLLIPYGESFILGLYSLSGSQQKLSSTADSRGTKQFLVKSWEFWQKFGEERIYSDGAKYSVGSLRLGFHSLTLNGPSQSLSKASPTAAPETLYSLVCLWGSFCFLDQCFLNVGRKDVTCWLQTRCQSMQRRLYCKQSLRIHFKRRKGYGEEKQNT